MNNHHGKTFFYIILGLAALGMLIFLRSYLAVIAFSVLLAMVFEPLHAQILKTLKNRQGIALFATYLSIIVIFVLPLALAGIITAYSIKDASSDFASANISDKISLTLIIERINSKANDLLNIDLNLTTEVVTEKAKEFSVRAESFLFGNLSNLASGFFALIPLVFIVLSVIGAVLANYHKISSYLHDLSPLDDRIDRLYVDRIKLMALSMVKGTFVIAFVQGLITGLFLWITGVPYAFILSLLAMIASVIPLGAGIITIPVGLILILTGNIWQGVLILLVQFLITSNVDNLLRPKLVNKKASMHPALVLIGLFAGIANFGFMGIIYGPVLMIFFVTTLEVYRQYFRQNNGV